MTTQQSNPDNAFLRPRVIGIAVPLLKRGRGYFTPASVKDTVQSSIQTILTTRLGERVNRPEFGSRLFELVFEQSDAIFESFARQYTVDALRRWEPRISIQRVEIELADHNAAIKIQYIVNENSTQDVYVLAMTRGAA